MDYFRKYLGAQPGENTPSGAETVERLCDRVQSSTLLEDRRDAVRALKSLSRKFRVEVGSMAMEILIRVLENDRNDAEIIGYTLETLCNVMNNEPPEEEPDSTAQPPPPDVGIQFTDVFMQSAENIGQLLSLLDDYDFHVRWPTVKLLTIVLGNKTKEVQESILANPMGISKLMDLLSDSREIIRNDGLLLLTQLTKGNTNIQKIVAFENAFERLIEIITEEGSSDGGIVVEDCLLLLVNLLKNNSSNQNFFKEGSYISRLAPYFELQPADQNPQGGWSAQKVTNVHLMLQVIRTLVSPNNPQAQISACQKVMMTCGLLEKLCIILMASGVPADVLTETIHTVSEVIRGNQSNQEYFASVMAPSNPPRPAIVVLLMSMVNEKQPFVLRCAVLYCFESFLYKNELGQSQIIQTLLPSTAEGTEVNAITAGQLLCGGLFSADSLSTWFAAVALLHAIEGNIPQKEQLLRVQLATSLGNPPVSLLQQCTNILAQGGKVQTRVGLLMLLCNWLANCPIAVTHFLHNSANVPFLISQVSASEGDELELVVQGLCGFLLGICVLCNNDQVEENTKSQVRLIIEKRIGLETFTDKLSQVSKHESYNKAAKKPQLNYQQPSDVIFDYEFTRLFKKLENDVLKAVSPASEEELNQGRTHSAHEHDSIVLQYKELIREQDTQLNVLRSELAEMKTKYDESSKHIEEMKEQLQLTKDQNSLLKASKGSYTGAGQGDMSEMTQLQQQIENKNQSIEEQNKEIARLKEELSASQVKSLVIESGENGTSAADAMQSQLNTSRLSAEAQELQRKVQQKEQEVQLYKSKYEDMSKRISEGASDDSANNTALLTERNQLSARVKDLEKQLEDAKSSLSNGDATDQASQIRTLEIENRNLKEQVSELEDEKMKLLEESEANKKEQDDLLVLLADQDTKMSSYKDRLKDLGETIEDDDDDDDFDDDDLDEEEGSD